MPPSISAWFGNRYLPETPKADNPAFERAHWQTILSSEHLERAAIDAAESAGFPVFVDNACDEWEYRDAVRHLLDRAQHLQKQYARACLISVGEVGVALPAHPGEGGRNQQLALWCATELERRGMHATMLSAGSDGVDGRSSAAGAVCDETTITRAAQLDLDVEQALAGFHAAPLLRAIGDCIETGPTGNNLRDLRLLLVTAPNEKP